MCPAGTDQTFRSAQTWQLIAPRIQQSSSLTEGYLGRRSILKSLFGSKGLFRAWDNLARPVLPLKSESGPSMSPSSANTSAGTIGKHVQLSAIESLPVELLLMILEPGDLSKPDILSLALAFPSLLPIIISHIQSSYIKAAAPWAGTAVAYVGSYTLDLPPSFMEDSDLAKKFEDWLAATPPPRIPHRGRGTAVPRRGLPPARKFFWSCTDFGKPRSFGLEEQEWRDALKNLDPQNLDPIYARENVDSLSQQLSCPELFPNDRVWVLRNLTTREYYIPQTLPDVARKSNEVDGAVVEYPAILGFDHVMLLKTCWTSSVSGAHRVNKGPKGSWAGHCFDIVVKEVIHEEGLHGWSDVSKELLKEAQGNWGIFTDVDKGRTYDEDTDEE